ncbi:protein of unknown function [Magnetospirillum sp. XM-1]|uniref:hypothetical protein n=1 Tax=Magnetospirillum sp. XM-1 TaxID=1663591 RepID=UPI00073DDD99|nr:hypothetical protein [Magnetospirillum sp. XM-1]CUW37788.1 protein of unknown function [Magnetospirillum sp. XM-1]
MLNDSIEDHSFFDQLDTEIEALTADAISFESEVSNLQKQNKANTLSVHRGRYELIGRAYRLLKHVEPKRQAFVEHFQDKFQDLGDNQELEQQVIRLAFGHPQASRKKSANNRNYSLVLKWLRQNDVPTEKAAEVIEFGIEPKEGYDRKANGELKKQPICGIAKITKAATQDVINEHNETAKAGGIAALRELSPVATGKLSPDAPALTAGMYLLLAEVDGDGNFVVSKAYGEGDVRTAKEVRSHAPKPKKAGT